jgi:hypothetical protein
MALRSLVALEDCQHNFAVRVAWFLRSPYLEGTMLQELYPSFSPA